MSSERSWPVRSTTDSEGRAGDFYCSPGCGGNCTWEAYQRCVIASEILARELGEGWTTEIHENIGWFWSVISPCGRLNVCPSYQYLAKSPKLLGYHVSLGVPGHTSSRWGRGKTAKIAITDVLNRTRAEVNELVVLMQGLR